MNYNLSQVLPLGVLTGSRAFNCATEKSDWDIVILESNLPNYTNSVEYRVTDFINGPYDASDTYTGKPGFNLSDYSEFEDEPFIEYDNSTIWGPLVQIIKYWDDEENCINLFVYKDHNASILDKFKQLNHLMNFVHNVKLVDKEYRIKTFTKLIAHVGITDTPH